jgi:hypothetical protein
MHLDHSGWTSPSRPRYAAIVIAGIVHALAGPRVSARESGIQFSPDGKRVFVSKDVGDQRFAITLNTDDGTVTGNVFFPQGGEPRFVACEPSPPVVNRFTCAVADACTAAPCTGQFIDVGEQTVPPDFFTATGLGTAAAQQRTPDADATAVQRVASAIASPRASGIQLSPDGKRIFVSKDVGGERFAITRNNDDHTVTGNVFPFEGGAPKFVVCEELSSETSFRCAVAGPCAAAPCVDQFVDVGTQTVPPAFFTPPDAVLGASDLSSKVTTMLEIGIAAIPQSNAVQIAAVQTCPDGGTVVGDGGVVVYDQCRIGKLVCSGDVNTAGDGISPTGLQCRDEARVKNLSLAGSVALDASGASVHGSIFATENGQNVFDLVYDDVAVSQSAFGTPESGKLTVQNHNSFFGGTFAKIDETFDGTQFIRIIKLFPIQGGFIVLVLDLDVTTGELIAR